MSANSSLITFIIQRLKQVKWLASILVLLVSFQSVENTLCIDAEQWAFERARGYHTRRRVEAEGGVEHDWQSQPSGVKTQQTRCHNVYQCANMCQCALIKQASKGSMQADEATSHILPSHFPRLALCARKQTRRKYEFTILQILAHSNIAANISIPRTV